MRKFLNDLSWWWYVKGVGIVEEIISNILEAAFMFLMFYLWFKFFLLRG